jgi:hypothetical protein
MTNLQNSYGGDGFLIVTVIIIMHHDGVEEAIN